MKKLIGKLLSLSEVARRLSPIGGVPINPATVYRWVKGGKIRAIRVGRRLLVGRIVDSFALAGHLRISEGVSFVGSKGHGVVTQMANWNPAGKARGRSVEQMTWLFAETGFS